MISGESGGNSQVMNASGHYGLYQFSASTWASGTAGRLDLRPRHGRGTGQVFNNVNAAGVRQWTPYDGCSTGTSTWAAIGCSA